LLLKRAYSAFFFGSSVVALELVPPLAPAALGPDSVLAAVSLFGASELLGAAAALELELDGWLLDGGVALEPAEAEPDLEVSDFEVSELAELDELLAGSLEPGVEGVDEALPEGGVAAGGVAALLDDEELGVVDDAPPEADPEVEPGALDGDDGVALLELDEPGAEDLLALSRSHAARPKASATATARVESFMGPPWVG
jgi:hypothetical protein